MPSGRGGHPQGTHKSPFLLPTEKNKKGTDQDFQNFSEKKGRNFEEKRFGFSVLVSCSCSYVSCFKNFYFDIYTCRVEIYPQSPICGAVPQYFNTKATVTIPIIRHETPIFLILNCNFCNKFRKRESIYDKFILKNGNN